MSEEVEYAAKNVEIRAGAPAPTTKGEQFKRHCARRWWIWLIGFIIFVVVIVIIVIFAIIPAVAQNELDNTSLSMSSITILDPRPDKFQISIVSHVTGGSGLAQKATIDGFDAAFYLDGQATFMSLPLPEVHGADDILVEKINYTTVISNKDAFNGFAAVLMESEEFDLGIYGETTIHLGSVKANVKYREWVTLKGFNKLKGMVIVSYTLAKGDFNIAGKVVIPNPSVFTLELGNVHIDISLAGSALGNGIIPNLIVSPGLKNTYDFKANLTGENILKLVTAIQNREANLQIQATDVEKDGVSVPWLKGPLAAEAIDVPVNITRKV